MLTTRRTASVVIENSAGKASIKRHALILVQMIVCLVFLQQ